MRSPMITMGACVFPVVIAGMIDPSAIRHWAAQLEVPAPSDQDIRFQIHLTGFKQHDLVFRILCQPARNNGTRCTGTDDYVVVARLEIRLTGGLVGGDGQKLVSDCGSLGYLDAQGGCALKKC